MATLNLSTPDGFEQLMSALTSRDNATRQAAEDTYASLKETPDALAQHLIRALRQSQHDDVRSMCAIMLRRVRQHVCLVMMDTAEPEGLLQQLKRVFTRNMACVCCWLCGKPRRWRLCSKLAGMQCSSLHTAAAACLLPNRQQQSLLSLLQTLVVEALWPKLSAPVQVRAALACLGAMACLRCHQDGGCQHSGTAQLHFLVAAGNDVACTTSMRAP